MKKEKILISIIVCVTFIVIGIYSFNNPRMITDDSGFDTSYDSGGSSWDSGSSWGSDSSWDRDYSRSSSNNSSYSSSSSSGNGVGLWNLLAGFIVFLLFLYLIINLFERIFKKVRGKVYKNLSDKGIVPFDVYSVDSNTSTIGGIMTQEEVSAIDSTIEIEPFLDDAFELYKEIQIAWMNFDYEKLRELLSDELYNQYKMQLEGLKLKNQKNIMRDFKKINAFILSVSKVDDKEIVKINLNISMYDYIIDSDTSKVVRGRSDMRVCIFYVITLERNLKVLENCPQCGAKGEDGSQVCKYCGATIVSVGSKFVMTKKENVGQR